MSRRTRTLLVIASLATVAGALAPVAASAATGTQVQPLGSFGSNETGSVHISVPRAGEYRLSFIVSYPTSSGRIAATVDGQALPVVSTPVQPDAYGAVVTTDCFGLSSGEHDIAVSGTKLPFPVFTAQLEPIAPA